MGQALRTYLQFELRGWKAIEVAWLGVATAVILGLSLRWQDDPLSLSAGLSGVWCAILAGKGKRSAFLVGAVNVFCYAWVAFRAGYYGGVILNLLCYLPMHCIGWFAWRRHMNAVSAEVVKRRLPPGQALALYGLTGLAVLLYGFLLQMLGGQLPYVDALGTVVSLTAQVLLIRRLSEQWLLWIFADLVMIFMWALHVARAGENVATLGMWIVYLLNALFMYRRWNREARD